MKNSVGYSNVVLFLQSRSVICAALSNGLFAVSTNCSTRDHGQFNCSIIGCISGQFSGEFVDENFVKQFDLTIVVL
jgi:hypothetical protein